MSQSAAAAAPAPPKAAPAANPAPGPAANQVANPTPAAPATRSVSTPRMLRRLSLVLVVTGVLVGLLGALVFAYLAYAVNRAEADTVQLIRVQKIQTNLLGADATATNAFLVGGLEPPAQRAAYDQAISSTGALIAEAAQAQPADETALAALNQEVVAYASTIEQARANNRQGFPVGSQYLRSASAQLRSEALPILDLLVSTNADRAEGEMNLLPGYVFVVVSFLALVVAVAVHVWLSRRFRRRINPGVLVAAILLLIAFVVGLTIVQRSGAAVSATRDGSFTSVKVAAQARIEANNAKANESLTLIARGSGSAFETAWSGSAELVTANLARLPDGSGLTELWSAYIDTHVKIRALDDGGSWDRAVATATGTGADSANTAFNAYDAAQAGYLDQVSNTTATSLGDQQPGLVAASILTLLAGLGAALLGRRGVGRRLEEYR